MPKRRKDQDRNPEHVLQDAEIAAHLNPTRRNRRAVRLARAAYVERITPTYLGRVA